MWLIEEKFSRKIRIVILWRKYNRYSCVRGDQWKWEINNTNRKIFQENIRGKVGPSKSLKLNFCVAHFTIVCALKCGNINFGSCSTILNVVSGFDRVYINILVVQSLFFMLEEYFCVICVGGFLLGKLLIFVGDKYDVLLGRNDECFWVFIEWTYKLVLFEILKNENGKVFALGYSWRKRSVFSIVTWFLCYNSLKHSIIYLEL